MTKFLIFCASLVVSSQVLAGPKVKIETLPVENCSQEYNSNIYRSLNFGNENEQCILTYIDHDSSGKELDYESTAIMKIDGNLMQFKARKKNSNVFYSKDGKTKMTLLVRMTGSTCVPGEDKCCGDSYSGRIEVQTPSGKGSAKVEYYRGG